MTFRNSFCKIRFSYDSGYTRFFYKQRQADIGKKNQAKAKQRPEAELVLFENYSLSSSTLSPKNKKTYS